MLWGLMRRAFTLFQMIRELALYNTFSFSFSMLIINCALDVILLDIKTFQTYFITRVHCAESVKNCQSMTMQFEIKQLRAHIASALK